MSRITISSSASARLAGDAEPGRPLALVHVSRRRPGRRPRSAAPASPPRPLAYSSARRISRLSCTPLPSSVKIRTPSAAISAIGASWLAGPADRDGAPTCARRTARPGRGRAPRGRRRPSRSPASVLGMATTRGEPAERGGPGAGLDRLGLLLAGLAEVGVQVDEAGRDDAAAGVERHVGPQVAVALGGHGPHDRRRRPARRPGGCRSASTTAPPRMTHRLHASRSSGWGWRPRSRPEPSRSNSTAMRTATPLRTWSMITERGQVGDVGRDLDAPVHRTGVHDDGACRRAGRPAAASARSRRCTRAATAAAPRSCARAACAAGTRRRRRAAPRRGRG